MPQPNDQSRSLAALDQDSTLIAVIEISQSSWLVAGMVPGINRQPLKKLAADEVALLQLLYRWREEASIDRAARSIGSPWPTKPAGMAFGWRGGCADGHRSPCDPPDECRRVARASPGEDGPARHRAAEACLPRLAAWRAAPLQHGDDPDAGRGRRQAAEP